MFLLFLFILLQEVLYPNNIVWADGFKTQQAILENQRLYKDQGIAGIIVRPTNVRFPYGEGTPTLYCSVQSACMVSFLPGDVPVSRTTGDSLQWTTAWWVSQEPSGTVYHMVFKPYVSGIRSNIIIGMNNGHSYDFYVESVEPTKLRIHMYSFYDPNSWSTNFNFPHLPNPFQVAQQQSTIISTLKETLAKKEKEAKNANHGLAVDPRSVEAMYKVEGSADWKPVSVFDDKIRVFIQFPPSVKSDFMPAFFGVSRSGQLERDAFSRVGPTMIVVPHLFRHGALVWGVGSERRRVDIIRLKHESKHWWNF